MVSSTPWPHFTPVKDPVPILQEAGWAPGPVWTGGKSRPHRDSIPGRPARSSVAIPTELPGPPTSSHLAPQNLPQRPALTHTHILPSGRETRFYTHIKNIWLSITLFIFRTCYYKYIYFLHISIFFYTILTGVGKQHS